MEKRTPHTRGLVFLCGVVFLLLLVSFFVYSQINAQKDKPATQAEFVDIIIRALGLEERLPVAATLSHKVELLRNLGYAPPGGWQLEKMLTKGDVAVVLAQILGVDVPIGAEQGDCVQALVDRGIMTPGNAEVPISLQELTTSVNLAAARPAARPVPYIPPYKLPVSPIR
jgi:hypothetical protein